MMIEAERVQGDLVERLRYTNEHGIFAANLAGMLASHGEAAAAIQSLTERNDALALQADEWEGKYVIVSEMNKSLTAERDGWNTMVRDMSLEIGRRLGERDAALARVAEAGPDIPGFG